MKLILGDCLEKLKGLPENSVDSIVSDPPYGISFMGKKWDYDVPNIEVWQECLRVLKPGGHALIACGTRTQHRMAVNLEDAGFEIRDIVVYAYGSGFPKSMNIGKAVDKKKGIKHPKNQLVSTNTSMSGGNYTRHKMAVVSEEGKEWEGWGTALKPSMELWTLCRKPLEEKTIAGNVLKHGTGGINIDGCRVGTEEIRYKPTDLSQAHGNKFGTGAFMPKDKSKKDIVNTGRFPANLIHDGSEEVEGLFPETKSGKLSRGHKRGDGTGNSFMGGGGIITGEYGGDSGLASRFFYCAKASKGERNKGLEKFEEKLGGGMTGTNKQSLLTGSGNIRNNKMKNHHPTVKPVKLMQYLCRLITPKGGMVLDPYMGSGTTGIGAKLEGFDFIGIEMEADYLKIAEARINAWEREEQLGLIEHS